MTTIQKTYPSHDLKAKNGGNVEALVSVFGNVDYQGDRVMKGAFDVSLLKWAVSGDPIPVIWSHDWKTAGSPCGAGSRCAGGTDCSGSRPQPDFCR